MLFIQQSNEPESVNLILVSCAAAAWERVHLSRGKCFILMENFLISKWGQISGAKIKMHFRFIFQNFICGHGHKIKILLNGKIFAYSPLFGKMRKLNLNLFLLNAWFAFDDALLWFEAVPEHSDFVGWMVLTPNKWRMSSIVREIGRGHKKLKP